MPRVALHGRQLHPGRTDKAREYLQKIIDTYPDTEWGRQAKERLARFK